MVTFASTKFEVRRPSRSEDTAHLVCQLSIYNSFPVIQTTTAKNRHFYVPRPSFFVCPGDAPVAIMQNVAWMKRQFSACQTPHSMYPSIFRKCKKLPFSHTAAHIFVSPGDVPAIITQYVAWMERQFSACKTPCSMYPSIFNSFRVIQCLSQCGSPKIAIFTTFLFPLGTPLGQSR